jgi:hypothetical protein
MGPKYQLTITYMDNTTDIIIETMFTIHLYSGAYMYVPVHNVKSLTTIEIK